MSELHRIPQNWHILTSTDPAAVESIIETLDERRYKTVSADEYQEIAAGKTSLVTGDAPVFFDRSGIDKNYEHVYEAQFCLDAITICARSVFTIEPRESPDFARTGNHLNLIGLGKKYSENGFKPIEIEATNHIDQADRILEYIALLNIEDMPHMG